MPIYEYQCTGCDHEFEVLVFKSNEKITCPSCDSKKVNRLMSGFAHKSEGKMTGSDGSDSCGSCSSSNCASCH